MEKNKRLIYLKVKCMDENCIDVFVKHLRQLVMVYDKAYDDLKLVTEGNIYYLYHQENKSVNVLLMCDLIPESNEYLITVHNNNALKDMDKLESIRELNVSGNVSVGGITRGDAANLAEYLLMRVLPELSIDKLIETEELCIAKSGIKELDDYTVEVALSRSMRIEHKIKEELTELKKATQIYNIPVISTFSIGQEEYGWVITILPTNISQYGHIQGIPTEDTHVIPLDATDEEVDVILNDIVTGYINFKVTMYHIIEKCKQLFDLSILHDNVDFDIHLDKGIVCLDYNKKLMTCSIQDKDKLYKWLCAMTHMLDLRKRENLNDEELRK